MTLPLITRRKLEHLRGFAETNLFCIIVLRSQSLPVLILSTAVFISGVVGLFERPSSLISWTSFIGGFLGMLLTANDTLQNLFQEPQIEFIPEPALQPLLAELSLTSADIASGYRIQDVPVASPQLEYVVRSDEIDHYLQTQPVPVAPILDATTEQSRVDDNLRQRASIYELALRNKYHEARRANPRRRFFNERKTCLASDLYLPLQHHLRIYESSYFHSFLTNELVCIQIKSLLANKKIIYSGVADYPALLDQDGLRKLRPIENSTMNDHIGVSTLIVTRDRKIVLWEQDKSAQQSHDRLAPTGSGSCDWQDWIKVSQSKEAPTLSDLLIFAMEREFKEESHPLSHALRTARMRTQLLGYFRWLRRGAKPEFVGISRVDKLASELFPNPMEVSEANLIDYDAASVGALFDSAKRILKHSSLSVPLWVLAKTIETAIEKGHPSVQRIYD